LSRKATLTLSDLAAHALIGYDRDSHFGRLLGELHAAADLTLQPALTVGSPQNACALVEAGVGVALVVAVAAVAAVVIIMRRREP